MAIRCGWLLLQPLLLSAAVGPSLRRHQPLGCGRRSLVATLMNFEQNTSTRLLVCGWVTDHPLSTRNQPSTYTWRPDIQVAGAGGSLAAGGCTNHASHAAQLICLLMIRSLIDDDLRRVRAAIVLGYLVLVGAWWVLLEDAPQAWTLDRLLS